MMPFSVSPSIYDNHRKPRRMIVEDILGTIAAGTSGSRHVIDIGCGTGAYASEIGGRLGIFVLGVDVSDDMITVAATKNHIQVLRHDCERGLPGEVAGFSFVYAVNFLHYVNELGLLFRSVYGSLHEGGCFYMAVHSQDDLAQQSLGRYFPEAIAVESTLIHSPDEIVGTLESVGFAGITISTLQQQYELTVEHFEAFRSGAYNCLHAIPSKSIGLGLSRLHSDIGRGALGTSSYTIVKSYKT